MDTEQQDTRPDWKRSQLFQNGGKLYRSFLSGRLSATGWLTQVKLWEGDMDREFPGWGGWRFSDFED